MSEASDLKEELQLASSLLYSSKASPIPGLNIVLGSLKSNTVLQFIIFWFDNFSYYFELKYRNMVSIHM